MQSRDNDRAECISESHLQFMRDYVAAEERIATACVDRFLSERKPHRDALDLKQIKVARIEP
jgi:hypothetical protein